MIVRQPQHRFPFDRFLQQAPDAAEIAVAIRRAGRQQKIPLEGI